MAAKKESGRRWYFTINGHLHHTFSNMRQRCYNPMNRDYKYYGGRGIKICFKSPDVFVDYVVNELRIDPRGLTIDRIDGEGNYEPGNIRFISMQDNIKNRRPKTMKKNLTDKQVQAYRLVSGDFEGLSTEDAAILMEITPQAVNRLLSRAKKSCPKLFPLLTKQEVDVRALHKLGWSTTDIADKLQVSHSRISQIIGSVNEKQGTTGGRPVKMLSYHPWMDGQIKEKF